MGGSPPYTQNGPFVYADPYMTPENSQVLPGVGPKV